MRSRRALSNSLTERLVNMQWLFYFENRHRLSLNLVPRRGLEPPRCYSLVPETSASTNSATWAFQERFEL